MLIETSTQASQRAKKELARRLRSADPGLEVVHPNTGGDRRRKCESLVLSHPPKLN